MIKSNKILPLFIITVFFLQFAIPASIFVHFKIYQDEIEAAFCVNIDKPEMNCHGQCHMQKQMAKVTFKKDKNERKSNRTLQLEEIVAIQNSIESPTFPLILRNHEADVVHYSNFYQSIVLTQDAPPPQV